MSEARHGTSRDAPLEALAARAASDHGDRDAFGALYDLTYDRVYAYVRARVGSDAVAEDVTEGVFVDALASIGGYRPRGGGVLAWLLRIARNDVLDHARRARRIAPLDLVPDQPDPGATPEEHALDDDRRARLLRAVAALPGKQRDVIEMRFAAGLSIAETAASLTTTEAAVKSLQFRAMTTLQEILSDA